MMLRANAEEEAPHGIELRHLRYFVAVADAGTFTHAAERIFIAQPTISQQIRRLEEMIGTPLLQRRREGVRLTTAGTLLLEESRAILSMVEHGMRRTRQAAGIGRLRLRVALCPGMPEALAAAIVSRLRDIAANADIEVAWLETFPDPEFTLIGQHRADACLGWLAPADQELPAPLDVMSLGKFEPDAWIPSSHPAARQDVISLGELIRLAVVHGPRRVTPGIYDAWLASLRSADSRFEFADPPFRQSLPLTLAWAAAAGRPTAVLTGPQHLTGERTAREDRAANGCEMVRVHLDQAPLTATAGLVWNGDLPSQFQQILFDVADGIKSHTQDGDHYGRQVYARVARSRAAHNPPVVGSSPTRPTSDFAAGRGQRNRPGPVPARGPRRAELHPAKENS